MTTKRIRFSYLTRVLILVGTAPSTTLARVHIISRLRRAAPLKTVYSRVISGPAGHVCNRHGELEGVSFWELGHGNLLSHGVQKWPEVVMRI